ncbi:MAG: hypothetical protein AMS27_09100 [Bacteroides sp. SM23_62_1]|nr:MAG: hypothetical protein AMS27_09100 [Bacteroides sp. SM23_62_1]
MTTHKDEIDLLELFRRMGQKIGQFFTGLLRFILLTILYFWKNALILLGFVVVGGFAGFGISKMAMPYYSSDMIAQINTTNVSEMMAYINDLHELCKENNNEVLSEYLQLTVEVAEKIKDINAFWIIDQNKDGVGDYVDYRNKYDLRDTTQRRIQNRFDLQVEVYDITGFNDVKKGLYNYVTINPYLNSLNENRKKRIRELIAETNNEILKLDSLQKYEYFKKELSAPEEKGQMLIWNEKETRLLHPDLIGLFRQKQSLERDLELFSEVITVVKDFTPLSQVENPVMKYIKKWGLYFGVLGVILKFLFDKRRNIRNFVNKKETR